VVATLHWCPLDYPPELAGKLWHSKIIPAHQYLSFTFGIKNASKVISPSKYYADLVERRCGVRPTVIPNPICLEKYAQLPPRETARQELHLDPKDFMILCVGRLDTEKGLKYLIQAFQSVIPEHPYAKLIIVGDGPLKSVLINMVNRLHLTNVVFAGYVTKRYLNLLLSAADLYISPSLYENFSISILDALASGLPIICTNIGGSPEIVEDNTNGLLISPRNSVALSEAILKMISNESMCTRFRENNKAKAKLFSEDVIFPKIIEIYTELLSSK
jgi:glycosyltransferase involved in cell wall biosynthesis